MNKIDNFYQDRQRKKEKNKEAEVREKRKYHTGVFEDERATSQGM